MSHIYLNHLGMINALGNGKQAILSSLGIECGLQKSEQLISSKTSYVGQVTAELIDLSHLPKKFNTRNNQLIATAYQHIAAAVEQYKILYCANRIGIILGTSTSGIAEGETAYKYHQEHQAFPDNYDYQQQLINNGSDFLAYYTKITGPRYTISTACSSSAKAIASAQRLLQADLCDIVIAGGCDSLSELTLNGFDALEALSETICQPFSQNRDGINIGEGAALFILSKTPSEIKLSGIGESSDGHHITAPHPEGLGAIKAINQAMTMASCTPKDIGYIQLHGTATQKNDEVESLVINNLFGENTPCSSIKPMIGHTLGAAGAQGLGLCYLLLSEKSNPKKILPKQIYDGQYDYQCKKINLIKTDQKWLTPRFMSNTFAFGGSNVSLIIEKVTDMDINNV